MTKLLSALLAAAFLTTGVAYAADAKKEAPASAAKKVVKKAKKEAPASAAKKAKKAKAKKAEKAASK